MSILMRGTRENFNPQIHTEANSLTSQMNKYFEVRRKSMDLFSRYTKFTSFMFAPGQQLLNIFVYYLLDLNFFLLLLVPFFLFV